VDSDDTVGPVDVKHGVIRFTAGRWADATVDATPVGEMKIPALKLGHAYKE
jgi:hypothetical protein